ncbi:porin family protein [Aestuariibaculum marinum]|uniref:TonB-dependent receptor n=1 Tax=Aestuariibaculum marinum TaxID=2683592 RepID=A0A8J6U636_9FLAO|nr:TonB-dependent receptor [Aestuariibaculum marinum]MBD0824324.1 TonB-dependent receptor [Aestuariibaculum marinum]
MRKQIKHILTAAVTFSGMAVFSQNNPKDTLNTGVIDVVKPYTPTISDAFKVKEVPTLDDETTATKKDIKYNIFSFPVASTFTPAKGKAEGIERAKPVKLFDNYATLGVGSYTTLIGELYVNHALSRTETVGGYFSHHSSGGGIEDLVFDDNFSDSKININYASRLRYMSWKVEGGFQHQNYNWYGVPESQIDQAQLDGIQVDHKFNNAYVGGDITFEDTYLNSGSALFRHFGDNQGAGENRFILKGKADIPINYEEIATELKIDYLGGRFDRSYNIDEEIKYSNFQIGLSPTYQLKQDDLTLDLGISVYFMSDIEASDNKLYLYPNVSASYRIVSDVLIAYGGIQGDLQQNSYYNFAKENPFVSPTLFVQPTDQLYNAFAGIKGKVTSNTSYKFEGHYISDKSKALFKNNAIQTENQNAYSYGNSFGVVYDDMKSFGVSGELSVDLNRNFTASLKGQYFAYSMDNEEEAWNLPDFKGSLFLDYQIDEKWFAGANVYFVGKRKDQYFVAPGDEFVNTLPPVTVSLDSYFDANAHAGYHITEQLSIFAKMNNIASQGYQRWQNFSVQSFQALAGATYKFDF